MRKPIENPVHTQMRRQIIDSQTLPQELKASMVDAFNAVSRRYKNCSDRRVLHNRLYVELRDRGLV